MKFSISEALYSMKSRISKAVIFLSRIACMNQMKPLSAAAMEEATSSISKTSGIIGISNTKIYLKVSSIIHCMAQELSLVKVFEIRTGEFAEFDPLKLRTGECYGFHDPSRGVSILVCRFSKTWGIAAHVV